MVGVYYILGDYYDMVSVSFLVYILVIIEIIIKFIFLYCNI